MIFTITSLLLLLYGCINFKKGLMLFAIYQIFWYSTRIVNISGLSLNTNVLLTFGYSTLYIIHKQKYNVAKAEFPYKIPFLCIMFSYILTCFFALSGFGTEFARALMRILRDYIFVWILWDTIEDKKDFKFLFKGITIVIFIGCMYGLVEYITGKNPLLDYKVILSSNTINLYNMTGLRGYRLTSFFEHPLGAGMTLGLYAIFVLVLWINKNTKIPNKNLAIVTAILCLPCVILTKMRSGILFTAILALCLLDAKNLKKRRFYYLILMFIIASPLIYVVFVENINLLLNLFTSNASSAIGGSSLSMRIGQMNAIANIFKMSPLAGLGETFRAYIPQSEYTESALGYEGLWFEQAVMHGTVGLIFTVVMIYYSVYKIPKKYKSKPAFIFALAYWIVYTFSSIPSFRGVLFFLAEFYFIKTSEVYKAFCREEQQVNI